MRFFEFIFTEASTTPEGLIIPDNSHTEDVEILDEKVIALLNEKKEIATTVIADLMTGKLTTFIEKLYY